MPKQPPSWITQSLTHIPETLSSELQTVSAAAVFITNARRLFLQITFMINLSLVLSVIPAVVPLQREMEKQRRKVQTRDSLPISSNMTCSSIDQEPKFLICTPYKYLG